MSHTVIIVEKVILPPPDAQTAHADQGEMAATVKYTPSHGMTDAQIGNQIERICKRLAKLADD